MLPLIVWGTFTTESKYYEACKEKNELEEYKAIPGVYALQKPYEELVCAIASNCPARFVNDARGVRNATANIRFVQHNNPRELYYDHKKGLHLLLQAEAIRDIEAGEQLFDNYGDLFWEAGAPIARQDIDVKLLESVGDEGEQEVKDIDSDDELSHTKSTTPSTDTQRNVRNASTLSQSSTPVSPTRLVFNNDDMDAFTTPDTATNKNKTPTSSGKRRSVNASSADKPARKKPTKSGGAQNLNLADMPQTNTASDEEEKPTKKRATESSKHHTKKSTPLPDKEALASEALAKLTQAESTR